MATMAFKCFSRMESTVSVDSHELTAAMKSDQFKSYLLTQLDFWSEFVCFAYNIFHVGEVFSVCLLVVVWMFEQRTF
jgi:hypothetical protein